MSKPRRLNRRGQDLMDDHSPTGSPRRLLQRWLWPVAGVALLTTLLGILYYRLIRAHRKARAVHPAVAPNLHQFQGLTQEEVEDRRPPSDTQEREQAARQVRRDIWRTSTFSIFNLSMLGLAAAQALLGDPLGALLTIGVFILNVVFNAIQQLYATGQVERLLELARPVATAVREGQITSIDVDEIVIDDVLVAGPGDEFLVDGQLLDGRPQVLETSAVRDEERSKIIGEGDPIQAGAYCLQGRAVYRVTALPVESKTRWTPVQGKAELTPLQGIIARVLRFLLAAIALFMIILFLDMLNFPLLADLFEEDYRNVASVFFSIAPSGLYFMIVATYALGSARLGDVGALIRESRAVESLAQVSTLCFSKTGTLTGAEVGVEIISLTSGKPTLAESRVRQILGDVAHTLRSDNFFMQSVAGALPGSSRPVEQTAGLLSAHGWSAVTFSEADIRGTYIIGEPAVLSPYWESGSVGNDESTGQDEPSKVREAFGRIGGFLRRNDREVEDDSGGANFPEQNPTVVAVEMEAPVETEATFFERLRLRMDAIVRPEQDDQAQSDSDEEPQPPQLLFAYSPEPRPLFTDGGQAHLPDDLIPLCYLTFNERIRPEAREAVGAFTEANIKIKILSSEDPERVLRAAEQLGLTANDSDNQAAVSGFELSQMDRSHFELTIQAATVFGQLTPGQKGDIVRTLRRLDEWVAMVGDAVDDVPAMEEANLSITLRNSSQAALTMADIVLLEDSLQVLPTVLQRGQKIVNGLLDILKLNLAQIGYVLLLIVVMMIANRRIFYYHSTQGGVIAFFTVIAPTIGLTLWASAGALPRQYMRSRLFHFVVPAAVTLTIATVVLGGLTGNSVSELADSWMTVTFGLVVMGLLLVIFVQPPTRFWVGGDVLSGDWRSTYMAIGLLLLFFVATFLPLTQQLLRLSPLANIWLYLLIAVVAIVWLFILRAIWRAPWLSRYVGIVSSRLERS
jgi:magnesium-transporting ATPase (P-type)